MAKIISLYSKAAPLTSFMVKALRTACEKQSNNIPFGQIDIHSSFAVLLKRGFIDAKTIIFKDEKMVTWYVTPAGKNALLKLGFKDKC
jgi:hypothetical protein